MKKFLVLLVIVALAVGGWFVWGRNAQKQVASDKQPASFNKKQFSLDDPTSLWVIVNKHRPLDPKKYVPADLAPPHVPLRITSSTDEMSLRPEAARALEKLYQDAKQSGVELMVASAYRGYMYQQSLYYTYVERQGQAEADTQSARPGHSEHQTGWAVDVEPTTRKCEVEACFADTPEGKWVAANAYKYGFVIRYQKDEQATTGYIYEPWHLRYVGKALAEELHKQGDPTLEEFFGLEAAPDYL